MSVVNIGRERGNMFVETLIILAVIGLMVLIAIPVYSGRASQSKLDQATREIERLALAEKQVAEKYGYYLPLQVLDDVPAGSEGIDSIANEPDAVRLIPTEVEGEPPAAQPAVAEIAEEWNGPYAQTKRVYLGAASESLDLAELEPETLQLDHPLDPWGTPYRFYAPTGIIGSAALSEEEGALNNPEFSDGVVTANDDRFDTFAIVSFGPNGQSDSMTEEDDDIIYLFKEVEAPEIVS